MKLLKWFSGLSIKTRIVSTVLAGTIVAGSGIGAGVAIIHNTKPQSGSSMEESFDHSVADSSLDESCDEESSSGNFSSSVESSESNSSKESSSEESWTESGESDSDEESTSEDFVESSEGGSWEESTSEESWVDSNEESSEEESSSEERDSDSEIFIPHEHDFSRKIIEESYLKTSATCENKAVYYYACECGEPGEETFLYGEVLGHDIKQHAEQLPTCTIIGWNVYETCSRCAYTTYEELPATGIHVWNDGEITTEPTCAKEGVKTYACTTCDRATKTEEVDALGHDKEQVAAQIPTCATIGWVAYERCARCGYTTYEELPATGIHVWNDGEITTEPTCAKEGVKTYACTTCDRATKTEEVDALGHDKEQVAAQLPTCVAIGWGAYERCTRCEYTTYEEVPATGIHVWNDGEITTKPTCDKEGVKTYACVSCTTSIYMENIPATGIHIWDDGEITTEPTCAKEGVKTYTCISCTTSIYTENIPATGRHVWNDGEITTEPTCAKEGVKTYICTVCNKETKTENIPATDEHIWGNEIILIEPTCKEIGVKRFTCLECEKESEPFGIPKTNKHTWDEGKLTKMPTCTEQGERTYTCTVGCGETKIELVEETSHQYSDVWKSDGSNHWRECTCGDMVNIEAHTIHDDKICTVCGYVVQILDGVIYEVVDGIARVIGCEKWVTAVRIVENYDGAPVVEVKDNAFFACNSLTTAIISDKIDNVGEKAFGDCDKLTIYCEASQQPDGWNKAWNPLRRPVVWGYAEYALVSGVMYGIQDGEATVIKQPIGIKNAKIPDSIVYQQKTYNITYVMSDAFLGQSCLTDVTVGGNITKIDARAFYDCNALRVVIIPQSVAVIALEAFGECENLTVYCQMASMPTAWDPYWIDAERTVVWGYDGYARIGGITYGIKDGEASVVRQLKDCVEANVLAEIAYKQGSYSVTTIAPYAFAGCESLTKVTIGGGVTEIGENAFDGCKRLTEVVIPDSVVIIAACAFKDCENLLSATIGNGVTEIGENAFQNCKMLTSVVIPDSVIFIGANAFCYCWALTEITFEDTSLWYRTKNEKKWKEKTGGTKTNVSDAVKNGEYFISKYDEWYWYKA